MSFFDEPHDNIESISCKRDHCSELLSQNRDHNIGVILKATILFSMKIKEKGGDAIVNVI